MTAYQTKELYLNQNKLTAINLPSET